jgi:hypothetical protein
MDTYKCVLSKQNKSCGHHNFINFVVKNHRFRLVDTGFRPSAISNDYCFLIILDSSLRGNDELNSISIEGRHEHSKLNTKTIETFIEYLFFGKII